MREETPSYKAEIEQHIEIIKRVVSEGNYDELKDLIVSTYEKFCKVTSLGAPEALTVSLNLEPYPSDNGEQIEVGLAGEHLLSLANTLGFIAGAHGSMVLSESYDALMRTFATLCSFGFTYGTVSKLPEPKSKTISVYFICPCNQGENSLEMRMKIVPYNGN